MKAVIQRINRKLRDTGQMLKTARGNRWRHELGDYYAVDLYTNGITAKDVDPETWARDLGVLLPGEAAVETHSVPGKA